jgi:hypothetical protein
VPDDLNASCLWRRLPPEIVARRQEDAAQRARAESVLQPPIAAHLKIYGAALDAIEAAHCNIDDNTNFDLQQRAVKPPRGPSRDGASA